MFRGLTFFGTQCSFPCEIDKLKPYRHTGVDPVQKQQVQNFMLSNTSHGEQ